MFNSKSISGSIKIVIITLLAVKLVGFLKQAVIAAYFGTSGEIDKFLLVSETMEQFGGAICSAIAITFLTIYTEVLLKGGRKESNKLISNVLSFILPAVIFLAIIFIIFSDQIANIIAPGYDKSENAIVSKYIKIFAVTLINIFIYYVCNSILEAEKIFFPGKVVGVIRSFCIIISIIMLSKRLGIDAMLVGTMAYYLLESAFIFICVVKKIGFYFCKPWKDERVKYLLKISIPLLISNGILQIQGIIDKAIASGLPEGGVSTLSYSGYLYNTTHSVLIGSICAVIFSYFTSYVAEKSNDILLETMYRCIRSLTLILVFVTLIFIGYSFDIVEVIYERGAFGASATEDVSTAFCMYSISLVFVGIRDIIVRAHYAHKNNKKPMINGIIGVIINCSVSILLAQIWGFAGIALGTSLSYIAIAVLSCFTIKSDIQEFRIMKLAPFFIDVIIISVGVVVTMFLCNKFINTSITIMDFIIKVCITGLVYICGVFLLKLEESNKIRSAILKLLKHN
ncbi:lipid II flippase MurJ [Gallibacter sp. Marseille-QA0791]|uniref:lipid II flippase MurJ n=1 Tax=Gallibacter sp. Marseille-QA0791 TaxID=3378781 RepID=UPI003D0C9DBB